MKNNLFKRAVTLIILGILLLALPVEVIGLIRNQKAFESEANEKIEYAVQSAAADLNVVFSNMENLVNMLQATVETTFSGTDYRYDYTVFSHLKQQTGEVIEQTLEGTELISGLYLTFSPDLHTGMEEVWYSRKGDDIAFIDARLYAPSWLVEGNPRVDYYYDAIDEGQYWGAPDYESSLDEYMATHTKSVYDHDGNLIGIVGSDMSIHNVNEALRSVKIYKDSQIALFDSNMGFCASNYDVDDPEKHFSALIDGMPSRSQGKPFKYTSTDGKEHIAAYTELNNGWILATTQTVDSVMSSAINTRYTLIATMLLTVIIIIVIVIVLIKRFYGPVIESAEQNEILMINQSRQAKLGEMVGNIAHQCKQPLNNINIDITNMKDDHNAGELTADLFSQYEKRIRENVTVMSDTITDFADFLKPDRAKELFSLKESVETALSIMKESLVINRINIINDVDGNLTITNYRNEFIQCIFNILENARDASIDSDIRPSMIKLSSESMIHGNKKTVTLHIFNSGDPIPDETANSIFLPYYSTKEGKGGTGIGLYLVKQITEKHFDGNITFANVEGGVIFSMTIKEDIK